MSSAHRFSDAFVAAFYGSMAAPMVEIYGQVKSGPYERVYSASGVPQNAKEVMQCAKRQVVLVDDSDTTIAVESYEAWVVEKGTTDLLRGMIPKGARGIADLKDVVTDWSPSGFRAEVSAAFAPAETPPKPDFTATDMHRRYRKVLDAAKRKPVFIHHKHELLTVDLWSRRKFERSVMSVLQDVTQFHGVHKLHEREPAARWAHATPYPWIAPLPTAEVAQFSDELFPYLLESVRRESLEGFFGNLEAWQTAAQAHGSREFQELLLSTAPTTAAGPRRTPRAR